MLLFKYLCWFSYQQYILKNKCNKLHKREHVCVSSPDISVPSHICIAMCVRRMDEYVCVRR